MINYLSYTPAFGGTALGFPLLLLQLLLLTPAGGVFFIVHHQGSPTMSHMVRMRHMVRGFRMRHMVRG
jgi:hypothetical protein